MNIQVLIATMHQRDHSLLQKMNIQTDAIVGNQCDENRFEKFKWKNHEINWISLQERGVGLNRNNALMRASAEIVVFADDDMRYVDNYDELIEQAYRRLPDADVIIFNLKKSADRQSSYVETDKKVGWCNYMRYGAARISAKLASIKLHGVYFNQCFGGGTEHSAGEDTLFLTACLRAGLKIYAVPEVIAELKDERESTWFQGYTEKYFIDKGILYQVISRRFWKMLCLQDALRHARRYKMSAIKCYTYMSKSKVLSEKYKKGF